MKKLSIFIIIVLVALASCTKSKEVHPEIGDGNDEIVTVGMKDVHVKYTRTDHAELQKVIFHYSLAEVQQFVSAEMTRRDTFFELTLDDLLCDALYSYYYELFYNGGETSTTERKTFRTQACDTPTPPTPPSGEHEYVDLGLPSGLLWATCNVGANAPEEYGDYFAWGETQPKDVYDWSTYQYCNGSSNTLTKYCTNSEYGYQGFVDNLTTLLSEDDAATANWGNDWRLPSKEEWEELFNNTTVTWTTQNGADGRLFTATNGNSLFFPAASCIAGSSLNDVGFHGDYWSNTLFTIQPEIGWYLLFNSDDFNTVSYYDRSTGRSVRAVRSQATPPPSGDVPTGAINGLFSVSPIQKVYFSQGNLQYQSSTDTWRFAEKQWDYVGDETLGTVYENGMKCNNSLISSTYNGWMDLFGWGTSGYHDTSDPHNVNYQPWSTSTSTVNTTYNYFGYGPSIYMESVDLTGGSANYDWGVYNSISNGGNTTNQWRTLTQPEWHYVLNTRNTTSDIRYAKANVNNVNGLILLPDNWNSSIYNLSNTNNSHANCSSNIISTSQWAVLESAGAVFLPSTGLRREMLVDFSPDGVEFSGFYWSATAMYSSDALSVYFNDLDLKTDDWYGRGRECGRSVRLVHDAN